MLAEQNKVLADLDGQRRHGRRRPRRQPQGRRALRHRGQATPRRPRPSAATTSRPASASCRASSSELQPTMDALGQVADDQALGAAQPRRLVQAADELLRPARPVRRRLAPGLQGARQGVGDRRPRGQGGAAGRSPSSAPSPKGTPELGKNLVDHPASTSTTASTRSRRTRAARGGQGYTGLEALLQYVYDQTTSTSRSSTRTTTSSRSAPSSAPCADYADARSAQEAPELEQQCGSRLGPNQPGINYPDVTDARRRGGQGARRPQARRGRPRPAAARRPGAASTAPAPRPSTPATPSCRRCRVPTPSTPTVPTPTSPACRRSSCRRCPAPAAATIAAAPRRCRRCPSWREDDSDPQAQTSSSTTSWRHEPRAADPTPRSSPTRSSSARSRRSSSSSPSSWPTTPTTACRSSRRASSTCSISNGANLVKGNEVRSGGFRIGVVDDMQPVTLPDRQGRRAAHAQARQEGRRGPGRLEGRHPPALRARPQVRRDHDGHVEEDASRRRRRCRPTQASSRSSSTSSTTCSTSRPGAPRRATCRASATRSPAAAPTSTRRSRSRPSCSATSAGHAQPVRPAHASCERFFKELGDTARIVAPVSKTNARLFTTMANTFEAISRDPQALKDTISKSPPTLRRRHALAARAAAVPRAHRALSRDLDAAATELRGALPTLNRALRGRHARAAALGRAERRPPGRAGRAQGPGRGADDDRRAARPDGHGRHAAAAAALPRPVHHGLQQLELLLDLHGRALLGARTPPAAPQRALLNMAAPAARARRIGASGANEFAHGKGALPEQRRRSTCTATSTAPRSTRRQRQLRGRPDTATSWRPTRSRQGVKGDPYQRVVVRPLPAPGALGPTYAQFDRTARATA